MTPADVQALQSVRKALDALGQEVWDTYAMTDRVQPLYDQWESAKAALDAHRQALEALRDKWRSAKSFDNRTVAAVYEICADELDILLHGAGQSRERGLIAEILAEYADELSREASDACEECGPLVMCRFHSVLSLLSGETGLHGAGGLQHQEKTDHTRVDTMGNSSDSPTAGKE